MTTCFRRTAAAVLTAGWLALPVFATAQEGQRSDAGGDEVRSSKSKPPGRLIFRDNFDRNESDEKKEELGHGWSTNSAARAGGHKQVDLRDGTMHIFIHKTADHAVSVRHAAEFRNGTVQVKFMLEHPQDKLGLDFADLKLKTVHAGHLFKVTVGTRRLEIVDMKTGIMDLKIREMRQSKKELPAEVRQVIAATKKVMPIKLETGKWYTLSVRVHGETIAVQIDGKPVGEFTSPGFGHPTKRMLRLSVPREAVIDDLEIYSEDAAAAEADAGR